MRAARWARAGLWALAAAHVAEAAVLRRRAQGLVSLGSAGDGAPGSDPRGNLPRNAVVVAVGSGPIDAGTFEAASRTLAEERIEALDLVPGDLPPDRALRLLRRVDPAATPDPLASPPGCHEALALSPDLAARAGLPPAVARGSGADSSGRADLVRAWRAARRHAPAGTALRVAPQLRARPLPAAQRWDELAEITAFARPYGPLGGLLVAAETLHLAAMTAGLAFAPVPAAAALATWSAQPALVFAGRGADRPALRPPLGVAAGVLRLPQAWAGNLGSVRAAWRSRPRPSDPQPSPPPETLFDPPRTTCPWCGGGDLTGRLDTTDLIQHKPGRFHLDECRSCGHVFQNPALSLEGLDHYYAEFYEGDGAETWELVFSGMGPTYARRMDALGRLTTPRAWLDVGTGHGHFCLAARQRWPEAVVDGLDLTGAIDEAARRGWVDRGYRGLFPDLADGLPRSYDVVSMHHYMEHTREPRRELAAAAKVLEPGGYLMIEGPDVESPWGRRLGRWWRCWFQPQHQHFVTCANLLAALDEAGFDVVSVERGAAGEGLDLASAVAFWANGTAPGPVASRWAPRPTARSRVRRVATLVAAVPLLAMAGAADAVKDARLRRPGARGIGNAYRVIARRR